MFNIKRKNQPMLGIDISSTSVKLVELSKNGGNYRVEAHSVEPMPDGAVVEKNISQPEAVGEAIKKALKKSGSKARFCAMAVPTSAVITKTITMQNGLSDDEMEAEIELEADQYIPYALEEVNLDFEVQGPTKDNPDTTDVLLAASRSENVEMRLAAASIAGLTLKYMDIESYATENAFHYLIEEGLGQNSDAITALVDVGASMTSINVIDNGRLIYTREQPFGGKQLTDEIMRRYGLSYEEAGLAKKEGGLPDNYLPEVLDPFKDTVAQQVHRFLQFFFAASKHTAVNDIVLAGGCAAIPGIEEVIEERIGTHTVIANPFGRMTLAPRVNPQHLGNDSPSLMIACGLALRNYI